MINDNFKKWALSFAGGFDDGNQQNFYQLLIIIKLKIMRTLLKKKICF